MKALLRVLAAAWRLAWPYFWTKDKQTFDLGRFGSFRMQERWFALMALVLILGVNLGQVYISVELSYWNNRFYTALQERNGPTFYKELFFWFQIVAFLIGSIIFEAYVTRWLQIRWRRWMTEGFLMRWMNNGVHYRLMIDGYTKSDNPDQRISEDIDQFIGNTWGNFISIFNLTFKTSAFVGILWGLSTDFSYSVGSFNLASIPGYLVWGALIYSIGGTWIAYLVNRPLIRLYYDQQHFEADFRFSLARLRENSEQVSLLRGEAVERKGVLIHFSHIMSNWYKIMARRVIVGIYANFYGQFSSVFSFILLAPAYFTSATMPLGNMMQTASAFGDVQGGFSFFVDLFSSNASNSIPQWKAVLDRLTTFEAAMKAAEAAATNSEIVVAQTADKTLAIPDLAVALPSGVPLVAARDLSFAPGQAVLINGPSGSGKTSIFRAIAGIWPYGKGKISVPEGKSVMLLPQRAYLPTGSLREAVTYPRGPEVYDDATVKDVLMAVGLGAMVGRLDDLSEGPNLSARLSGGEQQRVAVARAILAKPDFLFLDEATASLDEASEAALYRLLRERLPATALVSIGHRSSLKELHDATLNLQATGDGRYLLAGSSGQTS
ncbi:ABC transporter ATP-binding protein/permease [Oryzibacter oryziterrae]|uniref:ABC transporter ATP-binding protein/permease n=1 Tax=Oryzibacter oryziterrae TaxID=2766474 RepID=UPI001F3D0CB4|nr:ABC transporter ATP-binding protein/permease [Oryzibacter oryziterrae]